MALILDNRHLTGPGVHVVLIGVGTLTSAHTVDLLGPDATSDGFDDLESPLRSVEAFASWLQADLNVAGVPLKTIHVLASSSTRRPGVRVSRPTFQNLSGEIGEWFDDLDTDEDNVGIFYFCGHGLRIGEMQFLMAEDFGANRHAPFENTIEPELLANAMRKNRARKQLYLIDACSTEIPFREDYRAARPRTIIQEAENNNLPEAEQCLLRASKLGTSAFGLPGGPTLFMDALLRAMRGGGAVFEEGDWVIKTDMLRMALTWLIQSRPEGFGQQVSFGGGTLSSGVSFHQLPGRPTVPVRVTCKPREFESFSALHVDHVHHSAAEAWPDDIDIQRGSYNFGAVETTANGDTVHGEVIQEPIAPPYTVVYIPCEG